VPHLTAQQKCDKQDEIATRVANLKQRVATRQGVLQDRLAKAQAAGRTEAVTRIQGRLDHIDTLNQRIDTRYAKYQTWVAAHCDAPTTTTAAG